MVSRAQLPRLHSFRNLIGSNLNVELIVSVTKGFVEAMLTPRDCRSLNSRNNLESVEEPQLHEADDLNALAGAQW